VGVPPGTEQRFPYLLHGDRATAAHMVIQHSHEIPLLATDGVPPVRVPCELSRILGVNASVVLGADVPSRIGEIEFRHLSPGVIPQHPVDLGFGEP